MEIHPCEAPKSQGWESSTHGRNKDEQNTNKNVSFMTSH